MADSYLIDEIRSTIENSIKPCYHSTDLSELYVMCPDCGHTSRKGSAHYYLEMCPPFRTFCQKCGKRGVLNHTTLEELGIYNNDLELMIREANKEVQARTASSITFTKPKATFNYEDTANARTDAAVKYINSRFNSNYTLEELNAKFKCVADPVMFLKEKRVDVSKSKFDFSRSVGFVSSDNKYLICRDISGEQEYRYSNVKLTRDDKESSKLYSIRMPINRLNPVTTLVITEGIFDAIGVYNAFYKDAENTIIAAGCGKSFDAVIDKYKRLGYLVLKVVIYSDNDVALSKYKDIPEKIYVSPSIIKDSNIVKPSDINNVTICYNKLGKDTGVSPDKIDIIEYKC